MEFFKYDSASIDYLCSKDEKLAKIIDKVGPLKMPLDPDMFTAIIRNIIGQQISIPVYERIWADFQKMFGEAPNPKDVITTGKDSLLALGLTVRKTEYILGIAEGFVNGIIDDKEISKMNDEKVMKILDAIRGIGPWTVEMVLLFYLNRLDVFSFGDLCLIRGLKRLYGLSELSREQFEEYRKKFSPYGSIAMLYIWEVGEGRISLD